MHGRFAAGLKDSGFHRRRECRHRIPLGREPAEIGCPRWLPIWCAAVLQLIDVRLLHRPHFPRPRRASSRIQIVLGMAQDPVKLGLVASVARPGGNLTGVNFLATELAAKRLELLRELVPGATRVAAIVSPSNEERPRHGDVEAARPRHGSADPVLPVSSGPADRSRLRGACAHAPRRPVRQQRRVLTERRSQLTHGQRAGESLRSTPTAPFPRLAG